MKTALQPQGRKAFGMSFSLRCSDSVADSYKAERGGWLKACPILKDGRGSLQIHSDIGAEPFAIGGDCKKFNIQRCEAVCEDRSIIVASDRIIAIEADLSRAVRSKSDCNLAEAGGNLEACTILICRRYAGRIKTCIVYYCRLSILNKLSSASRNSVSLEGINEIPRQTCAF